MNRIDLRYFESIGGNRKEPFYVDVYNVEPGGLATPGPRVRCFVSTQWFNTWDSWNAARERALSTIYKGVNPILIDNGITVGTAVDLVSYPQYLFDRERFGGGLIALLNAAIDNEQTYEATLLQAEARRRLIESGKLKKSLQGEQNFAKYDIRENGGPHMIWEELEDRGNKRELACFFADPNPMQESKERLIRELMRLDTEK